LTHEKDPEEDEQNDWKKPGEVGKPWIARSVFDVDIDFVFSQDTDQAIELVGDNGLEIPSVRVFAFYLVAGNDHINDFSSLDLIEELTELDLFDRAGGLQQTVKNDDDDSRSNPEEYIAVSCDLLFLFGHIVFLIEKLF
jgi:hypothetical protein